MENELKEYISNLSSEFGQKISCGQFEKEKLVNAFVNYMNFAIKVIQDSKNNVIHTDAEYIKKVLNGIANRFYEKDINQIKHELLKDENYEKIRIKSLEIYEDAKEKALNGLESEKYNNEEEIQNLNNLFEKVESYNKDFAKQLISDAIVDLQFIKSENPKLSSLRIARFMKNIGGKAMQEKYLPIGTVVELKGATKKVMITGFCTSENNDENTVWDYSGCLYPEGILNANQVALFNHSQIEKIYHLGLIDEEEEKFKNKLNEILKENNTNENNEFDNLYAKKEK